MLHRAAVPLLAAIVAAPLPVAAEPPAPPELAVRYLGNEGFLVEGGGRRVLVDALFGDGIAGYGVVPQPLRSDLERGLGDWGDVSLALASHHHGDHFDAAAVGRFLEANPKAHFLSTPQAIERLRQLGPDPAVLDRCHAVLPAPGAIERLVLAGVTVDVLNLHHGRRTPPVENLGFVVRLGDARMLHFGDTEATREDFAPYLETLRGTDLALLPFWFLSSEWRADLVREHIAPRWIVAGHTPLPTAPPSHFARWGSYDTLVQTMRQAFPQAVLPRRPGELLALE